MCGLQGRLRAAAGEARCARRTAGLHADVPGWLHERHVAEGAGHAALLVAQGAGHVHAARLPPRGPEPQLETREAQAEALREVACMI